METARCWTVGHVSSSQGKRGREFSEEVGEWRLPGAGQLAMWAGARQEWKDE